KPHAEEHAALGDNMFARLQKRFEKGFADTRESYRNLLALAMTRRRTFVFGFLGAVALSLLLVQFLGEDFFPSVASGQITLHARTPAGTRVEDTTQIVAQIEREVRRIIPKNQLATIVDAIGLNQSPINRIDSTTGTGGLQDS